ncbi:MAG TPA: HD domain-containing phosphohydrolase [Pseudomonadales bacterium]
MEIVQLKVAVDELTLGMYVAKLDRPWLETPFKLQGFLLRDESEIEQLQKYCKFVYVDIEKGLDPIQFKKHEPLKQAKRKEAAPPVHKFTPLEVRHDTYREAANFKTEAKEVGQLQVDLEKALSTVTSQITSGKTFDQKSVKNVATNIVSSVIRNPDVMALLTRIRMSDDYLHHHSMRCAVWAALLGRHIGLRRYDMELMIQAALLKDIGKTRLPDDILSKDERELNSAQRVIYRKHVAITLQLLKQVQGLNPKVFPIIGAHRERYDGSGYPRHLKGDEIPMLAIVVGIATYYDELTNPRDVKMALAPSSAVNAMYDNRNVLFQEDIVVEFIQSLGIYPAGSIVELNTGELAIVVEQYAERRLRPRVVIATDADKQPVADLRAVDLLEEALAPQESKALDAKSKRAGLPLLYIVRDLPQDEYSLDLMKIKEKLFMPDKKRFGFFSFKF